MMPYDAKAMQGTPRSSDVKPGRSGVEKIPARIKIAALLVLAILGSLGLGFSLAGIFAEGPGLESFLGMRLVPLFLAFFFSGSFFLVLSLTTKTIVRMTAVVVCSLAFGFPFLLHSGSIDIPVGFVTLVSLIYAAALLSLDYTAKRAVATHSIFLARMFPDSYGHFFKIFVFSVGILVYFSSQLSLQARFTTPEEVLAPALNLVVSQIINPIQSQLGNEQFTEEKVLTEQITHDLEGLLEPYFPFLPLATAVGVALSLLFLTPIFAWSSTGFFALVYRVMVVLKFASFEQESRQVPVLKIV